MESDEPGSRTMTPKDETPAINDAAALSDRDLEQVAGGAAPKPKPPPPPPTTDQFLKIEGVNGESAD
jgi:hypothetical protein